MLCTICGGLMADPVVIFPNGYVVHGDGRGHTYQSEFYDRACIEARRELRVIPPKLCVPPAWFFSSQFITIFSIRSIILHWCDEVGHPHPVPISREEALAIVQRLKDAQKKMLKESSTGAKKRALNGERDPVLCYLSDALLHLRSELHIGQFFHGVHLALASHQCRSSNFNSNSL